MTDDLSPSNPGRRLAIGAAGGLAVGAVAGLVGGVAVAASATPPASVVIDGSRRFDGKVVLVTGGTSGIGRATAMAFALEGAKVAFCGRRETLGTEVEGEIREAGGEALYIRADVREDDQVAALVQQTVEAFGGLDIAFNNAGITLEKPLHEFTAAEWDDMTDTNLRGVFLSMKYQIPVMLERGGGTILVTSSSVEHNTAPGRGIYTASKRGLVGLVRSAALDYAEQGIRINAIAPGTTDTALVRRVGGMENAPDAVWAIGSAQWAQANMAGIKRMATAEEIAAFVVAMASPGLTYLNGSVLGVDGGTGTG
ncbi:SDR family NAD(P)-dependent oxidoreductase [Pseudooceanicola algae]|uniref:2,5-dichloro-2,5-cyclohexadiene-1,4-diol dehydrogenase n=1 Tax=Pseudooceanicola algae TaxID=1537215 RepID=A0A418SK39_9RHOB|nr:SDR family oxidoreductase [Pseudooceanicola algae]QPM92176.1 2,5-dichloro-2,5-cyclohexadiene-1,4-diol dehydrogenase [Pseudooceanicola algae]